jgi:hypothetical protein
MWHDNPANNELNPYNTTLYLDYYILSKSAILAKKKKMAVRKFQNVYEAQPSPCEILLEMDGKNRLLFLDCTISSLKAVSFGCGRNTITFAADVVARLVPG